MNKTVLLPEQMRSIARYEMTFTDAVPLPEDYDDIEDLVTVPEKYRFTLDDLCAAVKNLIKKDPTTREFRDEWYYPLCELEEAFGIDDACGSPWDGDESELIRGLLTTEEDVFYSVWNDFDIDCDMPEDEPTSKAASFSSDLEEIELFLSYRHLPIEERDFTARQKSNYIRLFLDEDYVKGASEAELRLCRTFTDELCEKGNLQALHLKGYSCYGGNRLYPCNWSVSRDLMLRLFDATDDPQYANTLGYIYYYGRCTDGVPEYEKAFEMFTLAAANGLSEATYKLGDMSLHGYACRKSPSTAKALYSRVYEGCYRSFLNGRETAFPDAALRMGNVFKDGIDELPYPDTAYYYYLQADYAHRLRVERSDFFGNVKVTNDIRKALAETRELLGDDFFRDVIEYRQPSALHELLEGGSRIALTVEMKEDGNGIVRARRVPIRTGDTVAPILLTEPRLDLCKLTREVTLEAVNIRTSFRTGEDDPCLINAAEPNFKEHRVDFYNCDRLVGWIACDCYRICRQEKAAPCGELFRLVSVRFQPNGRSYDYLCEDESVKIGDTVIVPGYSGDTEVEVINVYTKYGAELALPLERYKRVIRKVGI